MDRAIQGDPLSTAPLQPTDINGFRASVIQPRGSGTNNMDPLQPRPGKGFRGSGFGTNDIQPRRSRSGTGTGAPPTQSADTGREVGRRGPPTTPGIFGKR